LDGDGAYVHFKFGDVLADEPAFDMDVLDVIKGKWNQIKNEEMERKWREKSASR
jgi:hypothetical protein